MATELKIGDEVIWYWWHGKGYWPEKVLAKIIGFTKARVKIQPINKDGTLAKPRSVNIIHLRPKNN